MDSSSQLYSTSTSKAMGETLNISNSSRGFSSSNSSRHRSKEMESLSLEISKYPRDLLQTFLGNNNNNNSAGKNRSDEQKLGEDEEDDEGLNLGLGLSLGGKFGVDKSKNLGGLVRSSSIAGTMPLFREDDTGAVAEAAAAAVVASMGNKNLVRTSSLPVETEEEWRKRKEMQTLRRMEAKRRRSEKQRVLKESGGGCGGGGSGSGGSGGEEKGVEGLKLRARLEREQQCLGLTSKFIGSSMGNLFGSSKPPPPSNNNNLEFKKRRRTTFGSLQGFLIAQDQAQVQAQAQAQARDQAHPQPGSSQGSRESQGGTSSDASELESKTHQGSSSCGDTRSPPSTHSQQDRGNQDTMGPLGTKDNPFHRASGPEAESSSKQPEIADSKKKETVSSGIEDMPCVFTIGDGPNGRKVEGILYKYGKGEEVRIMCVCHGTFYSPSEFVKHAGGRDVEHPLRHIVVSPSTSPFQ